MKKIILMFITLGFSLAGNSFAFASHGGHHGGHGEYGEIEIGMESRHYYPGEGFQLHFDGPIKVTGVRILTRGDRNATLSCTANGVSCGTETYRRNWRSQWMKFDISNPRQASTINLYFGRRDPVIDSMVIEYVTRVNTVIKEVIKRVKVYVPKSQMGEMVSELRRRWRYVAGALEHRENLSSVFRRGFMLLSRANRAAKTHDGSDPDRRVGQHVDYFLQHFACTGFGDVYGALAEEYMFSSPRLSRAIENLGVAVFKLADIRRYDPDTCVDEIEDWLDQNPDYGLIEF